MTGTSTKKQMKARRKNEWIEHGMGYQTLRIRNISVDTSPRDLVKLFSRQHFHVADLGIQLICAQDLTGMQAIITLPEDEVAEAHQWANGRSWRGQKLEVVVRPEG